MLIMLAFAPFLWIVLAAIDNTPWRFMGALHDYQNSAVYLSEIFQGADGHWLTHFLQTPEPHGATLFNAIYAFLGQLSRLTGLPPVIMFHIGRAAASLFMYMAIYQMAAVIWVRLRTRRIFFLFAAVGSGFGWVLGVLMGNVTYLDLTSPEAFPFYSTLVNIHFPLAIACLCLFASVVVTAFKPGMSETPGAQNGGGIIFLLSISLVFVYPLALISAALAFLVYLLIYSYQQRRFGEREWRWLLWFSVPALPVLAYYLAVLIYNPVISGIYHQENAIPPAAPWIFVLSFGLPLLIALPGLWRGVRKFEAYGDQFMLVWLLVMVALVYLPTGVQQRFVVGIMIPIAYFATRAIEDFWFQRINRRWRYRILVGLIPLLAGSHFFVLFLPTRPIVSAELRSKSGLVLERDYVGAFEWLKDRLLPGDVVLASPNTSLWLPSRTGGRIVYGHPNMTLEGGGKRRAVLDWYGSETMDNCLPLLNGDISAEGNYTVRYVIVGPQENQIGKSPCIELLEEVQQFGSVTLYLYVPILSVIP